MRREYKCNVFRVHKTWKPLSWITDTKRSVDEKRVSFSYEGYTEEIYVKDDRPYCIQCGGKTVRNRKHGKAKVQTYVCRTRLRH